MSDHGPPRDDDGHRPALSAESPDQSLPPSVAFEILADDQARWLLLLLAERGGTISLDEAATRLVAAADALSRPNARSRSSGVQTGVPKDEEEVHTRLVHVVVPRLRDHDAVTVTPDADAVTLTQLGERLGPYLAFAREREGDVVAALRGRRGRNGPAE